MSASISVHVIDDNRVVEHQKKVLGRFFKHPLPPGLTETDIRLVMLNLDGAAEPTTDKKETLTSIIEGDIGKATGRNTVALVGRSGAGKTSTVVRLARKHFVIYICCGDPNARQPPDFPDSNFVRMAEEVEASAREIKDTVPGKTEQDITERDGRLKAAAKDRVNLELLARLSFLLALFMKDPSTTPELFFRQQVNGGQAHIAQLVRLLRGYAAITISDMIEEVKKQLATFVIGKALAVAIDEAHLADTTLRGLLISPSALAKNQVCALKTVGKK